MVELDSDTPTSWRLLFTWVDVVEGVLLHHGKDHPAMLSSADIQTFLSCQIISVLLLSGKAPNC